MALDLSEIRFFALEIHNVWRFNSGLKPHEAAERVASELDGTEHPELIDQALAYATKYIFKKNQK